MFNAMSSPRRALGPLALTLACLLSACSHGQAAQQPAPDFVAHGQRLVVPADSPLRKRLKIAPVELHQAPHTFEFPAYVEADPPHMANVLPALTGRVVSLNVDLGDRVRRGQLLAVIDSGDLAQAYADLDKARDAMSLAKKAWDRARGVQQAGGGAVKDLEAAHSSYVQASTDYRRARARLTALGARIGAAGGTRPMQVRAAIAGTVTALSITPGTFVSDPTAPMMTLANIDKVWITAEVPEDALGLVAQGQAVTASVPAWPGRMFHGRVASVGVVLDSASRRDPIRIAIDNADHALKPGMYARADIDVVQPAQVFVPESALLMNNDSTTVFVEVAPWTFERRTVELSYDESDGARVLQGLKAGDRVVVAGGVLLND